MNTENPTGELADLLLASYRVRFLGIKKLGDGALAQLEADEWHHIPEQGENSIAIIIQHLEGNMRSRWTNFLHTDGEKASRQRDQEFQTHQNCRPADILALWESGWAILMDTLESLSREDLVKIVTIRKQPLSVLDAINRQLSHYAYHVGQIVYLARQYRGKAWQSLSIPKDGSARYQAKPDD